MNKIVKNSCQQMQNWEETAVSTTTPCRQQSNTASPTRLPRQQAEHPLFAAFLFENQQMERLESRE
jgi:hypothetical protein